MERGAEGVDQALFLPGVVVGVSQRDEDVIRLERADRVLERGERRFIAELRVGSGVRGEGFDLAEDDAEALVSLVARSVDV